MDKAQKDMDIMVVWKKYTSNKTEMLRNRLGLSAE